MATALLTTPSAVEAADTTDEVNRVTVTMCATPLADSRAKDALAGAAIESTSLRTDDAANRRFYQGDVSQKPLAESAVSVPAPAEAEQWRPALRLIVGSRVT